MFTELRHGHEGWQYAAPRIFDAEDALRTDWRPGNVGWWVGQPSLREQWRGFPG